MSPKHEQERELHEAKLETLETLDRIGALQESIQIELKRLYALIDNRPEENHG